MQESCDAIMVVLHNFGATPSKATEILDGLAAKAVRNRQTQIEPDLREKGFRLQTKCRLWFMRYFDIKEPHRLISTVFPAAFKSTHPLDYHLLHTRVLGNKSQWKYQCLIRFENHVEKLIAESPRGSLKEVTSLNRLRSSFSDHFSFTTMDALFYWGAGLIDWEKSEPLARQFFFGKISLLTETLYLNANSAEIYVLFRCQTKLYLDDPKAYGRQRLLDTFDRLGTITRFKDLTIDDFIMRPPKTKNRKRRKIVDEFDENEVFGEWDYDPQILGDDDDT